MININWVKSGFNKFVAADEGVILTVEKTNRGKWGWTVIHGDKKIEHAKAEPSDLKAKSQAIKMFQEVAKINPMRG